MPCHLDGAETHESGNLGLDIIGLDVNGIARTVVANGMSTIVIALVTRRGM